MIFKGLVRVTLDHGVAAMVLKDVRLPIMTALKSDVSSMERADLPIDPLNAPVSFAIETDSWMPLRLDTLGPAEFGRSGLIVGKTNASALEYLVDHWVSGGFSSIDMAVAAARQAKVNGTPFLSLVERFAAVEERRRRPHWDDESRTLEDYVWNQELFSQSFGRANDSQRDVFAANRHSFNSDSMRAVVVPCTRWIGGVRVRGWDVLTYGGDEENRHIIASSPEGWQSGRLRRMDPALLDMFDRKGRHVAISQADLTAWQNWVAPILVKVPKSSDRIGDDKDPGCLAGFPVAKLADARLPIEFTSDVRVIDDPAQALDILCRSSRGYVIAGLGGDVLPPSFRKLAGRWLAVCVPRQWVSQSGGIGKGRCPVPAGGTMPGSRGEPARAA